MTIKEMCERKQVLGYSYEEIAELSGLPVETVQMVLDGNIKSPEYEVLKMLEAVLEAKEDYEYSDEMKEALAAYQFTKQQGEYTLEDYYALPDDWRVELIDGVIYDMAAPTTIHQIINNLINIRLYNFISKKKGKCIVMTAPTDVQLDLDNKTIVQPDVLVLCKRNKLRKERIFGAPDFIVEVLSPSTRRKDIFIKTEKYRQAGVREYWRVDWSKKRIYVDEFEKGKETKIYTFEDKVPVGIFDYECEVNFAEIQEYVSFWDV